MAKFRSLLIISDNVIFAAMCCRLTDGRASRSSRRCSGHSPASDSLLDMNTRPSSHGERPYFAYMHTSAAQAALHHACILVYAASEGKCIQLHASSIVALGAIHRSFCACSRADSIQNALSPKATQTECDYAREMGFGMGRRRRI